MLLAYHVARTAIVKRRFAGEGKRIVQIPLRCKLMRNMNTSTPSTPPRGALVPVWYHPGTILYPQIRKRAAFSIRWAYPSALSARSPVSRFLSARERVDGELLFKRQLT